MFQRTPRGLTYPKDPRPWSAFALHPQEHRERGVDWNMVGYTVLFIFGQSACLRLSHDLLYTRSRGFQVYFVYLGISLIPRGLMPCCVHEFRYISR